jgi:glycerol-3-phosphate dehydrogenase
MPTAAPLATSARAATLARLERETFDLVVIGGGITGAGIAREAVIRGLSVALLEARDHASGTSSRSSKLIHGGLRYLAMGDVSLVRSTALERKVIHRLAPHLAEPRWMVVPARSRAGLMKLRAGVAAYEKLGAVEEKDLHRNWGRGELAEQEPLLDRERFAFACVYREYLTDDARLVLANLRAAADRGAAVLNYAPVVAISGGSGATDGVEAECALSGHQLRVRGRCVINAAGPWVDAVRRLEDGEARPRLTLSKGIHVVVPAERLPVRNMLILSAPDRRSIFVIRRGAAVYLGTTDTLYGKDHHWPAIEREDVEYLLAPVARDLTCDPLAPEEIVAAWSGLRPLISEAGKLPSEISRKDEVWVGPRRVISIAGGKLTGYRPMAREAVERAAKVCGLALAPEPADEPTLPGGDFAGELDAFAASLGRTNRLSEDAALRLARLYGSEAGAVLERGAKPLAPGALAVTGEVAWAVEVEGAVHLEDVLYRRTRTALYDVTERETVVESMAAQMAAVRGWDHAQREAEITRARARLAADLEFGRNP